MTDEQIQKITDILGRYILSNEWTNETGNEFCKEIESILSPTNAEALTAEEVLKESIGLIAFTNLHYFQKIQYERAMHEFSSNQNQQLIKENEELKIKVEQSTKALDNVLLRVFEMVKIYEPERFKEIADSLKLIVY